MAATRMAESGLVLGVDVGGTFTDLFLLDPATGICTTGKLATTRPDQSQGVVAGARQLAGDLSRLATVVHATTVGTNALLERKNAVTGAIVTAGFRDVLEMRRRDRPHTWGMGGRFVPVVSRDLRLEVTERVLADGSIRIPVNPGEVEERARQLLAAGAQALSITFINSYANDANERAALAAAAKVWPNAYVNASSQILPELREFERASTTAINAYLQPVVADYLESLRSALRSGGFAGELLVVQSNGGIMTVDHARRLPVRTALSGPAAGVIAAAAIAEAAGFPDAITCDMGGTSFDVSLVSAGRAAQAAQATIDFGLVIRAPMVEITTIGAGGGSIASVDGGGLLQVGPESAGSDPGPACYGRGERPTVTDANLLLGRINPERPIGGLARLDIAAARRAIEHDVAVPLGLDAMAAADAILRVANARMAGAIRLVSIERGHNPKRFVAVPFGGAGALHCGALMLEVGLARALVPRFPGITSALGCVIADMRHDAVHTVNRPLDGLDPAPLAAEMRATATAGQRLLDESGLAFAVRDVAFELDMAYVGQTHTVSVPLPVGADAAGLGADMIRRAFDDVYLGAYGRLLPDIAIRIQSLRTAVIGRRPKLDLAALSAAAGGAATAISHRPTWFDGRLIETPIYDRLALPVGARIAGPAVLEQPDATTVLEPALDAVVDRLGNLVIARKER
jgi:N-methylhydantoinase A